MAQITYGLRAILSHPSIYASFQLLMGAHKSRKNFVKNYVKPFAGMKVLDIGCGPADILAYLSGVEYWGFDISQAYISQAKNRFGNDGHFICKQLQEEDLDGLPKFDVVLSLGLLHHLDDSIAEDVIKIAYSALKPTGRLITIDPCLDPAQNFIARFLIQNDRGQNVRNKVGYEALAISHFSSMQIEVRHQAWIPYTHCYMECQK